MLQHVDHIEATPEIIDLREREKWSYARDDFGYSGNAFIPG